MRKNRAIYICSECGYESPKWMGKCPGCNQWNSMLEQVLTQSQPHGGRMGPAALTSGPEPLNSIKADEEERFSTGLNELDRVMGGGIVNGSLTLIGGDPGIGKSTLLLQVCNGLASGGDKVLYVSGEESARQIRMRADRLGIWPEQLYVVSETNLETIFSHIDKLQPRFLMIDSIQTVYMPELTSAPGSVSQVRDCTAALMRMAKEDQMAVFIVGHVTKEGSIAGPRVLEHMVDTVLYFEGDRHHTYRILRGVKNRFGSTNEIGVFEMRDKGLVEIANPSELLLSGRNKGIPGSVVLCSMEGTRPVLAEIQSLVSTSGYGMARRMSTGMDYNRVVLLMAVLEKKVGMQLSNQDVYVNVAGGFKVDEPAADLAAVAAIASSFRNLPISAHMVVMGEVGLTGEIRGISQIDKRIGECAKMGFKSCIIPKDNLKGLKKIRDIDIIAVDNVSDALEVILNTNHD